ncbi:MerR family transcriptional regulator [Ruoffia tabacinasalis]|uniref:MerR family transcriptional regulator n=1 Tax=Ruoffia tabacinasalis TaxID=87458 RepID=A0ABS0LKQ3_9LACT|nr:MerR family transcriptional regulator [Ruoffia tabacinasalis]MBG9978652.1 MerR family transcriptional regulator [Ruoffia tabacinasalis]
MSYSIGELAKLAGISTRTLRHYDAIDLLKPAYVEENGYRIYSEDEVKMLQQIMFYREFGITLEEIHAIVNSSEFDRLKALETHYQHLKSEKVRISQLMNTVENTIKIYKEDLTMSKKEFEGFKKQQIKANEEKYGEEIREKYGDDVIDSSNKKFGNLTQEQYERIEKLNEEISEALVNAVPEGKPESAEGQRVAELHKEWLIMVWPDDLYSEEAHIGLAQMYTQDERFKKYYEDITEGAADYLYEAIKVFYNK